MKHMEAITLAAVLITGVVGPLLYDRRNQHSAETDELPSPSCVPPENCALYRIQEVTNGNANVKLDGIFSNEDSFGDGKSNEFESSDVDTSVETRSQRRHRRGASSSDSDDSSSEEQRRPRQRQIPNYTNVNLDHIESNELPNGWEDLRRAMMQAEAAEGYNGGGFRESRRRGRDSSSSSSDED